MEFIKTPQCNHQFGPPPGVSGDDCGVLHVKRWNDPHFGLVQTSYWRPNSQELKALIAGGAIALNIYGAGHPMLSMTTVAKAATE